MASRPKKAPREEHLGDARAQVRFILWLVGPLGVLGLLVWMFVPGLIGRIGMGFVIASCASLGMYFVSLGVQEGVGGPIARAFGRVLWPTGSSTPPAKALSHIEAMAVRGDHAKAVEAYKAEIATDPADVTSCERLGTIAMRQLADYDLAVWAYREAERRAEAPGRKFGFALIVVGICRDQLKDRGKTVVELRRLVQLYPNAPRIETLKAELDELKAGLFDDHGE